MSGCVTYHFVKSKNSAPVLLISIGAESFYVWGCIKAGEYPTYRHNF